MRITSAQKIDWRQDREKMMSLAKIVQEEKLVCPGILKAKTLCKRLQIGEKNIKKKAILLRFIFLDARNMIMDAELDQTDPNLIAKAIRMRPFLENYSREMEYKNCNESIYLINPPKKRSPPCGHFFGCPTSCKTT